MFEWGFIEKGMEFVEICSIIDSGIVLKLDCFLEENDSGETICNSYRER